MTSVPLRVGTLGSDALLTGPFDARARLAAAIEAADIDHLFVADHISFHDGTGMDGLVDTAVLTTLCPRLEVCVGVYLLALRHPVAVARQLASLARSAPGRIVLGVGVGGEDRHEIEICGVDPKRRGDRTDHSLSFRPAQRRAQRSCDHFLGKTRSSNRARRNSSDPHRGTRDAALRRAGRFGDGWRGVWSSASRFGAAVAQVEAHAEAAGRIDACRAHGMQIWVGVDKDANVARSRLARRMEQFYQVPYERFERYAPYGSPETIADALTPYLEAGCRRFNLMPVASSEIAGVEAIGEIARLLRSRDP